MPSYGVELTGKEILYFFFKRKGCPICGNMMRKEKKSESLGEGLDNVKLGRNYYGKQYEVTLSYRCEKCDRSFSIGELAGGK